MLPILLGIFGLLWGSFLNVCAYRLIRDETPWYPIRSYCPNCKQTLSWFDLLPVISYLWLRGICRSCSYKINAIYPCIELLTAVSFYLYAYFVPISYLPTSLIWASALIITIRTDWDDRVILRITSIFLLPLIYLAVYMNILPISLYESVGTSIIVYVLFLVLRAGASYYAKQEALGLGDVELLVAIAATSGVIGTWLTILIASFLGLLHGLLAIYLYKQEKHLIPFGTYLALTNLLIFPLLTLKDFYMNF